MEPKYEDITVNLSNLDGNAMAVMAAVTQALRQAGVSEEERSAYFKEATSSDYDNLLATTLRWVNVT